MRSDDNGTTWGPAVMLINDRTASGWDWYDKGSVWYDMGRVYLGITHRVLDKGRGWPPADYAPVVMRGPVDADLTKVENWTFSDEFSMATTSSWRRAAATGNRGTPTTATSSPFTASGISGNWYTDSRPTGGRKSVSPP